MLATNPNNDFWETPIGFKMMNDMMKKHQTSGQQKVFKDKEKNNEEKVLINTCNNFHPSTSNQIRHKFYNY
jgi:hypothetical protein